MKQSAKLANEESSKRSPLVDRIDEQSADDFLQPTEKGFEILAIPLNADYVAVAPIPLSKTTSGGIIISDSSAAPDTGIIVGASQKVMDEGFVLIGAHVKYVARQMVADLTGDFAFYGRSKIHVYRSSSIVAQLPQILEIATVITSDRAGVFLGSSG